MYEQLKVGDTRILALVAWSRIFDSYEALLTAESSVAVEFSRGGDGDAVWAVRGHGIDRREGLFSKKGRGDETPFELLLATLNGWPNSGRRLL